jgi:hypothetical protein
MKIYKLLRTVKTDTVKNNEKDLQDNVTCELYIWT